ncbi:MAG TPA: glycosyltransferase family 4 protein [Panacibacter sp.]|nr:glycosyltransferase family 4 protein [Panacibacter sp.]
MGKRVLFLTLKVFSATGGIEKVCRVAGKALYETGLQCGATVKIFSMYGPGGIADGNKYFPQLLFKGFNQHKIAFVLKSLRQGCKSNIVLLSHINLLLVGWLIKKCKPSTKLVLLAHGIEVWQPLSSLKKKMLGTMDLILPVSSFTKEKMKSLYGLPEQRFVVINNCLDPFLELPLEKGKRAALLNRYGLKKEQPVLLTVSRMVDTEQYKGYDKVLRTMPELMKLYPGIRYLLVGKNDDAERQRLDQLIENLNIKEAVIFTGFISDEELAAHFRLADIFVMPSEKEGFGIVFIEAMFYGLPVIAGNRDGSTDALCNGEMGLLIDPENIGELTNAIRQMLDKKEAWLPDQQKLMDRFSYEGYKEKLRLSLGV